MYVRGAGNLGKPSAAITFDSDSETETPKYALESEDDAEEKEAYVERVRQRLAARKQEDDERETLRVKEKHLKIKNKLKGTKKDNSTTQAVLTADFPAEEEEEDEVQRLEREYHSLKNSQ